MKFQESPGLLYLFKLILVKLTVFIYSCLFIYLLQWHGYSFISIICWANVNLCITVAEPFHRCFLNRANVQCSKCLLILHVLTHTGSLRYFLKDKGDYGSPLFFWIFNADVWMKQWKACSNRKGKKSMKAIQYKRQ